MADDSNSGRSPRSVNRVDDVSYSRGEPTKTAGNKRSSLVDEDDSHLKAERNKITKEPGLDPRFQQQNQSLRCFVMYTDFYRCENILGEQHEACCWFKDVYHQICPSQWISAWDDLRVRGLLPWHKHRTQGDFPGTKYGER